MLQTEIAVNRGVPDFLFRKFLNLLKKISTPGPRDRLPSKARPLRLTTILPCGKVKQSSLCIGGPRIEAVTVFEEARVSRTREDGRPFLAVKHSGGRILRGGLHRAGATEGEMVH
jgi:hypothetical protein